MKTSLKRVHQAGIAITVMASHLFPLASQAESNQWSDGIRPVQSCDIGGCQVIREIVKLPAVIDRPGRYVLRNSLHYSGEGVAIYVTAKNVEIDMLGNALHGPYRGCGQGEAMPYGARSVGVGTDRFGVTMKNGLISGFGQGIDTSGWSDVGSEKIVQITGMRIVNVLEAGLQVSSNSFRVENNLVANVGGKCIDGPIGIGLYTDGGVNTVVGNSVYNVTSNPNNPFGEYAVGIAAKGTGIVRLTNNKVYNAQDIGVALDVDRVSMHWTTIANYRGRGDVGLRVGLRYDSTVRYSNTDITGFYDGVSVGQRGSLIDLGNNIIR